MNSYLNFFFIYIKLLYFINRRREVEIYQTFLGTKKKVLLLSIKIKISFFFLYSQFSISKRLIC